MEISREQNKKGTHHFFFLFSTHHHYLFLKSHYRPRVKCFATTDEHTSLSSAINNTREGYGIRAEATSTTENPKTNSNGYGFDLVLGRYIKLNPNRFIKPRRRAMMVDFIDDGVQPRPPPQRSVNRSRVIPSCTAGRGCDMVHAAQDFIRFFLFTETFRELF